MEGDTKRITIKKNASHAIQDDHEQNAHKLPHDKTKFIDYITEEGFTRFKVSERRLFLVFQAQ